MVGKVYNIAPEPLDPNNTRYFEAGVVRFGVEYRDTDADALRELYGSDARQLAELERELPDQGFDDEGISLHVIGTADGHEYLRFDLFDEGPHYHYIHRTPPDAPPVNNVIEFDRVAHGDMLPWAVERLRSHVGPMLAEAGAVDLAAAVDESEVWRVLPAVEELATEARARHREARRSADLRN